jgi:hypothetical protein
VIMKAVSAIAYLKDWTAVPHIYGQPEAMIPFSAPDVNVDGRWKEWQGRWHDEGKSETPTACRTCGTEDCHR